MLRKKPTGAEVEEHEEWYREERRGRLEERIRERMERIQGYQQIGEEVLRSKTQQRVRMRDELERLCQQEKEENKHLLYRRK